MTERETPEPPYWQLDALIGDVSFYRESWSLRLKAHLADGPYGRSAAQELIPLTATRGTCTSVDAKAYILVPDIRLDVSLSPPPAETLGTVDAATWEGMRPQYVGEATAFYYHEDRVLVLWECYLEDQFQQGEPAEDTNYAVFWRGLETLLVERWPEVRQLVTTADDPLYEPVAYQRFLTQLGYAPLAPSAYGKAHP